MEMEQVMKQPAAASEEEAGDKSYVLEARIY
jgi:hypothetical protein